MGTQNEHIAPFLESESLKKKKSMSNDKEKKNNCSRRSEKGYIEETGNLQLILNLND